MTFTGLSTNTVNIQVNKGSQYHGFDRFIIKNDNHEIICTLPFTEHLNDCSDTAAVQGEHLYRIDAVGQSTTSVTVNVKASPLTKNGKFYALIYDICLK